MFESYIGQILLTSFGFAPRNYSKCDGGILPVNQYQALFSLLGVTYGGNGSSTFQLPDLRGRTAVGGLSSVDPNWQPPSYVLGQRAGTEQVTLSALQNPAHAHGLTATATTGVNQYLDGPLLPAPVSDPARLYGPATATATVSLSGRSTTVGGQPHTNIQPYLAINFIINLAGIFPSRS